MSNETNKKAKIDLIWEMIQFFQEEREANDMCEDRDEYSDIVLSYNDVENSLYEFMEKVDPKAKDGEIPLQVKP